MGNEYMNKEVILSVKDLRINFRAYGGLVQAVRGIDFNLHRGETLAIVGESGSGKSVSIKAIMGILANNAIIESGEILYDGMDLTKVHEDEFHRIRGKRIGLIFQDPLSALNPIMKIGHQITEVLRLNDKMNKHDARAKALELMKAVGIPDAERRFEQYPFQFSGGMRQRIIIAIALACDPKLIIADEPTTALDVTIQAQVLELISNLKDEIDSSIIMITHDLGVVASICDRIAIMYGGKIVEQGTTDEIFYDPKHPYTKGLLSCISNPEELERKELHPIPGSPPDLLNIADNCPFADRCENAMKVCKMAMPEMKQFSDTHICSCWLNHPMAQGKGGAVHE